MADNTSMISGLFQDPLLYQQAQDQAALQRFTQLAQLDPLQQAQASLMYGGYQAGGALGRALGGEDPMLQRISQQQQLLSNVDYTNAKSLAEAARQATAAGRPDIARQLAQDAIAIQTKVDEKQAARDQALMLAREKIAAQIEAARIRGEDQKTIAQMQIEGRKELAAIAASFKQGQMAAKPLSTQDIKMANELTSAVSDAEYGIDEAKRFTDLIDKGQVKFGAVENLASKARAFAGQATPSDVNKSDLEKWITSSINAVLNQAKGVQAKDDAERAQRQIMEALDKNDPKLVKNGIVRIQKLLENTKENATSGLELLGQERNRDLTGRVGGGKGKADPLGIR